MARAAGIGKGCDGFEASRLGEGDDAFLTFNVFLPTSGLQLGELRCRGSWEVFSTWLPLYVGQFEIAVGWPMFVLYIDGSGSSNNLDEDHFVLAGVAVYESQIYHMIKKLDDLVDSFDLGPQEEVELHGSPMYGGRGATWRAVQRPERHKMMNSALNVLTKSSQSVRAFGIAVNKSAISPRDPVDYAFEEICNRFNLYLTRRFRDRGGRDKDKQKGLIVMDKSHYEQPLQALAREFRVVGARWGKFRNLAEVPLFLDSKASRLVQIADLVAFALWRRYEHSDGRFFEPIVSRFDASGGVIHGLVHRRLPNSTCYCPACMSRNNRSEKSN